MASLMEPASSCITASLLGLVIGSWTGTPDPTGLDGVKDISLVKLAPTLLLAAAGGADRITLVTSPPSAWSLLPSVATT